MTQVVRFDRIELPPKVELTPEGWLKGDAILTRSGVFTYTLPDGSKRREYRPPDEVFKPASLKSFAMNPITVSHPATVRRMDGEPLLDSDNASRFTVGATGCDVRQDGNFVRAPIAIFDAKAVRDVQSGKRGLSCGYKCKLDFTPGVSPEGESYDAVQRDHSGNHTAIVDAGRAGKEAQIRLDSAGNQELDEEENLPMSDRKLSTVKLDGIDYEAAPEVANALAKAQGERDSAKTELGAATAALKTKTDEADATKAKMDSATAELLTLKAQDRTAEVAAAVKARVALEGIARRVLPADAKLDEMDDAAIRKAVILAKQPTAKLDGQTPTYVQARFDSVVEALPADDKKAISGQRQAATARTDGGASTAAEARQRMIARTENAWKPKTSAA